MNEDPKQHRPGPDAHAPDVRATPEQPSDARATGDDPPHDDAAPTRPPVAPDPSESEWWARTHGELDEDAAEPEPAPRGWRPPPTPRLRAIDVAVLLLVLLLGAGVRFARLHEPGEVLREAGATVAADEEVPDDCVDVPRARACYAVIPLDEKHYVPDARDVVTYGTESDTRVSPESGAFVVHPPVGKWLIATGMLLFGDDPFGWRFAGALAGTLGILVIYLLALRLWGSTWWAAAAAFLLAVEGLWLVQSRVAMLDIFEAFFILLGVWLLVEDRARSAPERRGPRPLRISAGIALGLAFATKWSAAPFLVLALLLALAWEARRSERGVGGRAAVRAGAVVLTFTLIPAAVYLTSYVPWLADDHRYLPPACEETTGGLRQLWCYHGEMLDFHRGLDKYEPAEDEDQDEEQDDAGAGGATASPTAKRTPGHPYFGHAWSWPWAGRPVVHHYEASGEDDAERRSEVVGIPNVAIWWPAFFLGIPVLGFLTLRRDRTATLLFLLLLFGYAPYLVADAIGRPVFMFYATPIVPFLVLAVVHLWVRLVGRFARARIAAVAYLVVAAAVFAYLYPVLAAIPVPEDGWLGWTARMWLRADCGSEMIKLACWI